MELGATQTTQEIVIEDIVDDWTVNFLLGRVEGVPFMGKIFSNQILI